MELIELFNFLMEYFTWIIAINLFIILTSIEVLGWLQEGTYIIN